MKKFYLAILLLVLNSTFLYSQKKRINRSLPKFSADTLIELRGNTILTFDKTKVLSDSIHYFFSNATLHVGARKTKIYNSNYSQPYSELNIALSPNHRYMLLDRIEYGFVYINENDSVLHQNYFCDIIDVRNAKIKLSLQSDCDGFWNNKNQFVKPDGKVLFNGGFK